MARVERGNADMAALTTDAQMHLCNGWNWIGRAKITRAWLPPESLNWQIEHLSFPFFPDSNSYGSEDFTYALGDSAKIIIWGDVQCNCLS